MMLTLFHRYSLVIFPSKPPFSCLSHELIQVVISSDDQVQSVLCTKIPTVAIPSRRHKSAESQQELEPSTPQLRLDPCQAPRYLPKYEMGTSSLRLFSEGVLPVRTAFNSISSSLHCTSILESTWIFVPCLTPSLSSILISSSRAKPVSLPFSVLGPPPVTIVLNTPPLDLLPGYAPRRWCCLGQCLECGESERLSMGDGDFPPWVEACRPIVRRTSARTGDKEGRQAQMMQT